MTPQDLQDLLDRFLKGNCTSQEEEFVKKWYNAIGREHSTALSDEQRSTIEGKLWSKLQPKAPDNIGTGRTRRLNGKGMLKIAAAILLLACAGMGAFLALEKNTPQEISTSVLQHHHVNTITVVNDEGTPCDVELADGSRVTLEPSSEICFPHSFIDDKREVYLNGKAFFDVTKKIDQPFLVYSKEIVTKVLGTSFSVRAFQDENEITVSVKSGKVLVLAQPSNPSLTAADEIILTPNQEAVYDRKNNHVSRQLVVEPAIVLEKPTLFNAKYDAAPVVKILEVIEENFGVNIVFDEKLLSGCTLTTSMNDEGLFERIQIICEAIDAQYKVIGTDIFIITTTGCQ